MYRMYSLIVKILLIKRKSNSVALKNIYFQLISQMQYIVR